MLARCAQRFFAPVVAARRLPLVDRLEACFRAPLDRVAAVALAGRFATAARLEDRFALRVPVPRGRAVRRGSASVASAVLRHARVVRVDFRLAAAPRLVVADRPVERGVDVRFLDARRVVVRFAVDALAIDTSGAAPRAKRRPQWATCVDPARPRARQVQ